ncbi:MAG: presqualene diphosphate synthase HpnD [Elusimicrobia bacterium]|nr:presqualene diphosphate synthase HpnD [Elusimicrobiota bacterium]
MASPESNSNFFYGFLFLPKEKRQALSAFYAYCRAADDAVDLEADPSCAAAQVEEWRRELDRMYSGSPQTAVGQALQPYLERFSLPRQHLEEILDGVRMDLEVRRYLTFRDLERYLYLVASAVGLVSIEIFGYRNATARDYAISLGKAFQITNILRDVRTDAQRGRIYLPLEDLSRFGYSEGELLRSVYDDRFVRLMQSQADRAGEFYRQAQRALSGEDWRRMLPARIMSGIYGELLNRMEAGKFKVFQNSFELSRWRKMGIASRAFLARRS